MGWEMGFAFSHKHVEDGFVDVISDGNYIYLKVREKCVCPRPDISKLCV